MRDGDAILLVALREMEAILLEESLEAFKRYIETLFSVNIADPNVSCSFSDRALGAIGGYASGRLSWSEFATRCDELLASLPPEAQDRS